MAYAKILSTVALVAALGAVSPAFAQSIDMTTSSTSGGGPADETGLTTLGIDISRAGGTPDSVQQFIAGLNVEAQRGVVNGCQTALANPVSYSGSVLAFCQNAVGAQASGPMLGFAPETPVVSPAQPYEMPTMIEPSSGPVLQPDTGEAY